MIQPFVDRAHEIPEGLARVADPVLEPIEQILFHAGELRFQGDGHEILLSLEAEHEPTSHLLARDLGGREELVRLRFRLDGLADLERESLNVRDLPLDVADVLEAEAQVFVLNLAQGHLARVVTHDSGGVVPRRAADLLAVAVGREEEGTDLVPLPDRDGVAGQLDLRPHDRATAEVARSFERPQTRLLPGQEGIQEIPVLERDVVGPHEADLRPLPQRHPEPLDDGAEGVAVAGEVGGLHDDVGGDVEVRLRLRDRPGIAPEPLRVPGQSRASVVGVDEARFHAPIGHRARNQFRSHKNLR